VRLLGVFLGRGRSGGLCSLQLCAVRCMGTSRIGKRFVMSDDENDYEKPIWEG
jgi:hypothetical protein